MALISTAFIHFIIFHYFLCLLKVFSVFLEGLTCLFTLALSLKVVFYCNQLAALCLNFIFILSLFILYSDWSISHRFFSIAIASPFSFCNLSY